MVMAAAAAVVVDEAVLMLALRAGFEIAPVVF